MSKTARSRSRRALPVEVALLFAGCAVGAPDAADDDIFGEIEESHSGEAGALDLDAEAIDPGAGELPDSSLPPWLGTTGGGGTSGASTPPSPRDAGGGARDGATGSNPPRDAGGSRPPPARDAGLSTGCDALSCTNECSVAGPFPCCTLFDTCGCTWAPGAYCL